MQKDFSYSSTPSQVINIPSETGALDIGDIHPDKGNEIGLIYPDGLYCLLFKDNQYDTTPVKIIDERTIFTTHTVSNDSGATFMSQNTSLSQKLRDKSRTTTSNQPAILSFIFDIDNDGLDDVILPQTEGFVIYFQNKSRINPTATLFAQSTSVVTGREISINFPAKNRIYSQEIFSYSQNQYGKNLNLFDFNKDGKLDIVKFRFTDYSSLDVWNGLKPFPTNDSEDEESTTKMLFFDEMDIFLQDNQRQFPKDPSFTIKIPRYAMENHNFLDIDGDGYIDLLFQKVFGDVTKAKLRIRIILNDKKNNFLDEFSQIIRTKDLMRYGKQFCIDINNDGALDLYLFYINISPTSANSMVKAFFERGIPGKIRFYLFDKSKRGYPKSPNFEQKISIGYNLFDFSYEKPNISPEGDFNGDKKKDLVIQTEKNRLSIYRFIDEKKGFETTPFTSITSQPIKRFYIYDLNNDGISDIITKEKASESLSAPSPYLHIYLSK